MLHTHCHTRRQERGVYTIMTALVLVVLLGFVGLAVDSSRQQAVHVELQNAADACALAGAAELNGLADAPTRATLAGQYVGGQRNYKQFQDQLATIASNDVAFSDKISGPFLPAAAVTTSMRFVRCTVREPSFVNDFMALLGLGYSDLEASAIAALQPSRTSCSAPLAVCGSRADSKLGLSTGKAIYNSGSQAAGDLYEADFSTCTLAESTLAAQMKKSGACNITTEQDKCKVIHPSMTGDFEQAWNTRFGVIHADEVKTVDWVPDLTGYAYPAPEKLPRSGEKVYDYETLSTNPFSDYKTVAAPGRLAFPKSFPGYSVIQHADLVKQGAPNRRLVVFPVIDCAGGNNMVIGWACGLMLNPVGGSDEYAKFRIQYVGPANAQDSPCSTAGIPGGGSAIGPLVPALVQ